MKLFIFKYNK